ncbi:MAG: UDP-glucose/GDP-mannose dehydrogenase family protein [Vicinamibacteria bacterium]|jgi:UDPglucose 6-dehydrogenase|nr:UDP-glucose/GDP-mannose dehydrogenase family protein [Vicinamibacteria bacterium]
MKIGVVGTGYVGLVAAACFAENGNAVIGVDIDEAKIKALLAGQIPIYEPGLAEIVVHNVAEGRLRFTTDISVAVRECDVLFIAVGTPQDEDGSADLQYVLKVAEQIADAMNGPKIVVNKSTVPVGTAAKVRAAIEARTKHPVSVVSNPEFLKEGAAVDDFLKPDRVVIGTSDPAAEAIMKELYDPFVRTGKPILAMDNVSAELTKYASNAMLALRISFMNEVANLCDAAGADVEMVRKGMATDSRIGPAFLFPGLGYGGSCFPKDVKAIEHTAREHGSPMEIVAAVERVNARQKMIMLPRMEKALGGLEGRKIAVWGVAFKPRTDDIREAPALFLIEGLIAKGAIVSAYDPKAMDHAKGSLPASVRWAKNGYDALEGADALLLATEWNEFREPDFMRMKSLMRRHLIFDGRNIFNPKTVKALGFEYVGVGRR